METTTTKTGVELIAEERREQIEKHGWTLQHDLDIHYQEDLERAALALVCPPTDFEYYGIKKVIPLPSWAVSLQEKLKNDTVHRLKVVGALAAAAIDRYQLENVKTTN